MCGIVGYIGEQEASVILLAGLRELEYRGYDSAGIAVLEAGGLRGFKAVGKLNNLAAKLADYRPSGPPVTAIGHTRWTNNGKAADAYTHLHGVTHSQVGHNGVIENYVSLRKQKSVAGSQGSRYVQTGVERDIGEPRHQ